MNIDNEFPGKYLKASDLQNRRMTVAIEKVASEFLGDDKLPVVYFKNQRQGLPLNRTNRNSLRDIAGPETDDWIGIEIVLYATRTDFQGRRVDAIRIDRKTDK